ncbi:MAG: hypothetical protein M9897_07110 [Brumimicrobium sp.]|nr:hypothetical protein [Brumimicrobium sp.]
MKKLFALTLIFFASSWTFAQGSYDDLVIIKADKNWDKLIKTAEKYTLSNSTKNDPTPYYYLAYGLYKISFIGDRDEKYKNAYKDAYNAIGKMIMLDKSGDVSAKFENFIEEMKMSLLELTQNELDVKQYPRAFGWGMRFYKFGRSYAPAYYLDAALRYRRGDRTTANIKWQDGEKLLNQLNVSKLTDADKKILMTGLYESADALKDDRQMDGARKMLNLGAPYFENNKEWKELYDKIVN